MVRTSHEVYRDKCASTAAATSRYSLVMPQRQQRHLLTSTVSTTGRVSKSARSSRKEPPPPSLQPICDVRSKETGSSCAQWTSAGGVEYVLYSEVERPSESECKARNLKLVAEVICGGTQCVLLYEVVAS